MGLEVVVEEVRAQGRAEAAAIRAAAQAERERILAGARAEGASAVAAREEEGRRAAERHRVQALARAELESKKLVLGAQKQVLDEVYQGALVRLRTMSDASALLQGILERNRPEWSDGRVFANAADAERVRAVVGRGFAGAIDSVGGVVIESADGSRRIDLRFESILAEVWTNVVREVANALWPPA